MDLSDKNYSSIYNNNIDRLIFFISECLLSLDASQSLYSKLWTIQLWSSNHFLNSVFFSLVYLFCFFLELNSIGFTQNHRFLIRDFFKFIF